MFDARIVVGRRDAVEIAEHLDLQVESFGYGLDHEVGRGGFLEGRGERQTRSSAASASSRVSFPALDRAVEPEATGGDVLAALRQRRRRATS